MKKIALITMIFSLLFACGERPEKKVDQKTKQSNTINEDSNKPLPSADYSSLFNKYECDLTVAEVATALNISESNVSISEYQSPGRCSFLIKGFGENALGQETTIQWKLEKVGKQQVNKEIKKYLKDQTNNENVLGMGIELSETGDSYIAKMPFSGRLAIMNGNYDSWMFMNYAPKGIYKSRTKEQHAELGEKMIALANYLLKKHKK
tara:strand:- start:2705 stop:3325 length:621 start_codon:yes stop_codon:yes gene_type:complete